MKTLKKKIEVMQAALDGKEIEYVSNDRGSWTIKKGAVFNKENGVKMKTIKARELIE